MRDKSCTAPAVNGFELVSSCVLPCQASVTAPLTHPPDQVLSPKRMVKDVAYAVNAELEQKGIDSYCLNCAREESTVNPKTR